MAGDMFLMLDGIKGESADDKHKGEIDILSFSWGLAQMGSGHQGTGSGTGKVDVSDISIMKTMDKSSPTLQLACANGKHITKGKITLRKAGESPLEYLTIDIENILVSSYQVSGSHGGGIPTESIALNFVKVKTEYWTQGDKGAKGENANFSWDVAQNKNFRARSMAGPVSAAEEKLRAGDLPACLLELQAEVRRNPAEPKSRIFLAQLLMVLGEWDRALTQLNVIAEMDAGAIPMTRAYSAAIQCERLRASILKGERSPLIFGDPEPWLALVVQGLAALAAGRAEQADAIRAEAFEAAPATVGSLNGTHFEWIADADSRLGPVLEVLLNGAYYWVPFHRIAAIQFEAPADLRDLVWLPAQFTWANGGEAMGFIPTRYAGTETAEDSALRLSRKTEWTPIGSEAFAGRGQRVLATSADEVPLLEVRELRLTGS